MPEVSLAFPHWNERHRDRLVEARPVEHAAGTATVSVREFGFPIVGLVVSEPRKAWRTSQICQVLRGVRFPDATDTRPPHTQHRSCDMTTPDNPLTPQETILISLLAATDAIWLPSRECHGDQLNPAVTNAWELRKQFRESGVSWSSGERTEAGRKQAQRDLEELAHTGLVKLSKPNDSRTLFVKLTDAAYDRLRRQSGLPGFEIGFLMLRLIALYSIRPATVCQHVYVPETKLNKGRGWGDGFQNELFAVHQRSLPALVAGWLDSRSDCQRHVYFSITSAGWSLLDDVPRPDFATEAIKRDSRFELAYYHSLHIERARLFTRTPDCDGELGWLALPVAHHGISVSSRSPA